MLGSGQRPDRLWWSQNVEWIKGPDVGQWTASRPTVVLTDCWVGQRARCWVVDSVQTDCGAYRLLSGSKGQMLGSGQHPERLWCLQTVEWVKGPDVGQWPASRPTVVLTDCWVGQRARCWAVASVQTDCGAYRLLSGSKGQMLCSGQRPDRLWWSQTVEWVKGPDCELLRWICGPVPTRRHMSSCSTSVQYTSFCDYTHPLCYSRFLRPSDWSPLLASLHNPLIFHPFIFVLTPPGCLISVTLSHLPPPPKSYISCNFRQFQVRNLGVNKGLGA